MRKWNVVFIVAVIGAVLSAVPLRAQGTNNLVGWWALNEGAGTNVFDSSGNNKTGSIVNTAVWTTGPTGGALSFSNSYVDVPDNNGSLNLTKNFTVSLWAKFSGTNGNQNILSKGAIGTGLNWHIFESTANKYYFGIYGRGLIYFSTTGLSSNTWYYMAVSFSDVDGTNGLASVYLDGNLVTTGTITEPSTVAGSDLYLGQQTGGNYRFNGALDDVRIYNRVLSNSEVTAIYNLDSVGDEIPNWWRVKYFGGDGDSTNEQSCATCDPDGDGYTNLQEYQGVTDPQNALSHPPPSSNMVGWWKCDEGSGTNTVDASGRNMTGRLINGAFWTNGITGNAVVCSNTSSSVSVPYVSAYNLSNDCTVALWMWVNAKPTSGSVTLASRGGYYNGWFWGLWYDGSFGLQMTGANGNYINSGSGRISTGQWYHVAVTVAGTNATLYLNGSNIKTGSWTGTRLYNSQDLLIGSSFLGRLDDVRVYQRALSSSEIAAIYSTDSVGDGISNWWRVKYFGGSGDSTNELSCASSDPDGDGFANLEEFNALTNPNDVHNFPTTIDGLIGWWKLDENTGTMAYDSSGHGYNGTLVNGPTWTNGVLDSAVQFGSNTWITIPTQPAFGFTTEMTLSLWIDPLAPPQGYYDYLFYMGLGYYNGWCLYWENDRTLVFEMTAVNGNLISSTISLSTGEWYQVSLTLSNSVISLYLNGALNASATWSGNILTNSANLYLGGQTNSDIFPGAVDDVRLYSRALSSQEILAIYDFTPPEITATVTPAPNEYGWNNTNVVVVSFSATDTVSGVSWYGPTYPVSVTGETNDCEVMAVAVDNAGNAATNYVYVNIDTTPPVIDLDPGQGQQFNNSHPLLIVDYSDPTGANTNVTPSGVNPDTLQVWLNGNEVTTNFYRFSNRAILSTNLALGTYTWSATIADYASNTMTQTGTFTATGATNAAAPVMSGLNVSDSITLMPDVPEIWLQGNISGTGSTVYASVNGGEAQPLNMRGGTFGYLLPLDYGTNVIVLAGGDGTGTNVGSQVLLVERSDKFQASVETPVLGMFANGSNVVASGVVSAKYAAGTEEEMTLVSLTINGVAATLGTPDAEGKVAWSTSDPINLVNGQPNREAISMTATLCWSDGTNTVCRTMPWGLLEGYEIVGLRQSGGSVGLFFDGSGMWPCMNQYQVVPIGGDKHVYEFSLSSTNTGRGREAWEDVMGIEEGCVAEVTEPTGFHFLTQATYGVCTNTSQYQAYPDVLFSDPWCWYWEAAMAQPLDANGDYVRGLSMGYGRDYYPGDVMAFMMEGREEGVMTFRAPMQYPSNTVVLLTLEGMTANSEATTDALAQVKLAWAGSAPTNPVSVVTNAVGGYDVSYLVPVDGGREYTLSETNFDWPTNIVTDASETHTNHWLSFTGFHNGETRELECVIDPQWHHFFPQRFKDFFQKISKPDGSKVNINDKDYGWILDMKDHTGGGGEGLEYAVGSKGMKWWKEWQDWMGRFQRAGTTPTYQQLQAKLAELRSDPVFKAILDNGRQAEHSWSQWSGNQASRAAFIDAMAIERGIKVAKVLRRGRLVGRAIRKGGLIVGFIFLAVDVASAETASQAVQRVVDQVPGRNEYLFAEELLNNAGYYHWWEMIGDIIGQVQTPQILYDKNLENLEKMGWPTDHVPQPRDIRCF